MLFFIIVYILCFMHMFLVSVMTARNFLGDLACKAFPHLPLEDQWLCFSLYKYHAAIWTCGSRSTCEVMIIKSKGLRWPKQVCGKSQQMNIKASSSAARRAAIRMHGSTTVPFIFLPHLTLQPGQSFVTLSQSH